MLCDRVQNVHALCPEASVSTHGVYMQQRQAELKHLRFTTHLSLNKLLFDVHLEVFFCCQGFYNSCVQLRPAV